MSSLQNAPSQQPQGVVMMPQWGKADTGLQPTTTASVMLPHMPGHPTSQDPAPLCSTDMCW